MATGTSVFTKVPWVFAGMQRGSSVRSHQSGGATGASRSWAVSSQPSAESRSHMQSAASADATSSSSTAATANAWRRVLMKAKSKSTATSRTRKRSAQRSEREQWRRGVKPGCKMSDSGRGERTVWWSVSPPVAQGVNAESHGSIPSRMSVLESRLGTRESSIARGVRAL